jgi:hypothetical protein
MPPIKRRHFLQFAGSTLAVIGLSQLDFLRQADHYGRVLAQSTPRKLALLIGINAYDDTIRPLKGCLTDVELQRQLLLHRFGFQKTDILEVSDIAAIKPTRANILQTFNEHIIQQAKPGDVVVIHFSGHGSRVKDPNPLNTEACRRTEDCDLNGTMVPLDGLPVSQNGAEVVVPDIMGRHLFLLMESIKTDFVTVVLDSCHSGAGTRGNANVRAARARAEANEILVSTPEEREVQEKLRSDLGCNWMIFKRDGSAALQKESLSVLPNEINWLRMCPLMALVQEPSPICSPAISGNKQPSTRLELSTQT